MSVDATYNFLLTPQETLTGADGATAPTIYFDAFNVSGRLNADSTPPATKVICKTIALTAGAYTLDLTTETGTNGAAIAGTGLRVQMIRVRNNGANAMTFSEGASNGLALACGTFIVPAGGIVQMYLNDAAPDIAAGDRAIDVAGTTTQEFELTIILG